MSLDGLDAVVKEVARTPARGPTLVEYILEKTGAKPKPSAPPPPVPAKGSLVDYILEKTGAAPKPTPVQPPAYKGNGATPPTGGARSLRDYILEKTGGALPTKCMTAWLKPWRPCACAASRCAFAPSM